MTTSLCVCLQAQSAVALESCLRLRLSTSTSNTSSRNRARWAAWAHFYSRSLASVFRHAYLHTTLYVISHLIGNKPLQKSRQHQKAERAVLSGVVLRLCSYNHQVDGPISLPWESGVRCEQADETMETSLGEGVMRLVNWKLDELWKQKRWSTGSNFIIELILWLCQGFYSLQDMTSFIMGCELPIFGGFGIFTNYSVKELCGGGVPTGSAVRMNTSWVTSADASQGETVRRSFVLNVKTNCNHFIFFCFISFGYELCNVSEIDKHHCVR